MNDTIDAMAVLALERRLMPLLAGQSPAVQGAALADLLAMWLAGHITADERGTARLREDMLQQHIATVRELIAVNAGIIHGSR